MRRIAYGVILLAWITYLWGLAYLACAAAQREDLGVVVDLTLKGAELCGLGFVVGVGAVLHVWNLSST